MRTLFAGKVRDFITAVDEKNIIRLDADEVAQLLDEVESGDSL